MAKQLFRPGIFILLPLFVIATALKIWIASVQPTFTTLRTVNLGGENAYYRPRGDEVSGFKRSQAKYHRSPCPALNTLANHGYLSRDGKDLTPDIIIQAIVQVYNLDAALAEVLVSPLADRFTLADLGEHNVIEHDASLVHDDAWKGGDPSYVNATLVSNLLSRSNEAQQLSKEALAAHRREREAESTATTSDFEQTFTFQRALISYSESAIMLLVMGDHGTSTLSVDHAHSFLMEERIPDDYEKPTSPVTLFWCMWTAMQLKVLSFLSPILI
ncbi:hypothetical protein PHYBOEH_000978 [Phytophthora boehmeriae]|uniref:Heme haloperoxidase family profile domain-containing protein n=1 Tax=Phytophthora boehmeriae TaxID=109152 RepID=A0A8T1V7K1_9STRA|nr:hypothetical protein PHYBOEH_000978 [Phytophthora boehmeriae]